MQKPTAVVVFGILNIVFGAMVLCMFPCALGMQFIPAFAKAGQPDMMSTPFLRGCSMASLLVQVFMAIWQVSAGVGLVRSRSWGRTLAISYGYAIIFVALVSAVVGLVFVSPAIQQEAQKFPDPVFRDMMVYIVPFFIALSSCSSLIYPVLLLIFMSRQNVKDYFVAVAAADAAGQPLHPPEAQMPAQAPQQPPPPPPQPDPSVPPPAPPGTPPAPTPPPASQQ